MHQAIPPVIVPRQFATYAEAIAALPATAEWSSSFGDMVVGCSVYFRDGGQRWEIKSDDPRYGGWVLRTL